MNHRSASISVIVFSKDVCNCGRLKLVEVWDDRINDSSFWVVDIGVLDGSGVMCMVP